MNPSTRERLVTLLQRAAVHLRELAETGTIPDTRSARLDCVQEIEECRSRIESGSNEREVFVRVFYVFAPSLDWSHLANDFDLADDILSVVEPFVDNPQ